MARSAACWATALCLLVLAVGSTCAESDVGARRFLAVVNTTNTTNTTLAAVARNVTAVLTNSTVNATALPRTNLTNSTLIPSFTNVTNSTLTLPASNATNASLVGTTIPLLNTSNYTVFSVLGFGAVGNGTTNDTTAVINTFKAACSQNATRYGVVHVPAGYNFLVGYIALKTCNNVIWQILGNVVAYPYQGSYFPATPQGVFYLQVFSNFTVQGNGTIDGTGYDWWQGSFNTSNQLARPDLLHFDTGSNLVVTGVTLQNAPQVQLYLKNFKGAVISGVKILAPQWTPNTDGIDLVSSSNVTITNVYIDTGDDNVALKAGASNIQILNSYFGHGHGASIGSLGENNAFDTVTGVVVRNITFNNTLYGARIKTFPQCAGLVSNVTYQNLRMNNVTIPIYVDQNYCCQKPEDTCTNASTAVGVAGVTYSNITGSTTPGSSGIVFNCAGAVPCSNILLSAVNLTTTGNSNPFTCNYVEGVAAANTVPALPAGCLGTSAGNTTSATNQTSVTSADLGS